MRSTSTSGSAIRPIAAIRATNVMASSPASRDIAAWDHSSDCLPHLMDTAIARDRIADLGGRYSATVDPATWLPRAAAVQAVRRVAVDRRMEPTSIIKGRILPEA